MNHSNEKTTLYRYFDSEGQLLYVGITKNPFDRQSYHAANQPWWQDVFAATYTHFENRADALKAEAFSIGTELPKYNKQGPVLPAQLRPHLMQIIAMDLQDELHTAISLSISQSMHALAEFSQQPELYKLLFSFDRAFDWNEAGTDRLVECRDCLGVLDSAWYKQQMEHVDFQICQEAGLR
jgi:hypothetical protein